MATTVLATGELASHSHTRGTMNIVGALTERPCSSSADILAGKGGAFSTVYEGDDIQWGVTVQTSGSSAHKNNLHKFDASKGWSGETSYAGKSIAHNILQSYFSCYFYKRIS